MRDLIMIQMIDMAGNIYEAEGLGHGEWYITWPCGGMRFRGTVTRLRAEMRLLMLNKVGGG
jgi:hypothetical protein